MKYVIRKVPERNTEYLERILPSPLIFCDENHLGTRKSFEEAIKLANDDALYVQDDMILAKGFVDRSLEYINKYKDDVIVFANITHDKKCKVFKEGFVNARAGGWLLCTYIPKRIAFSFLHAKENGLFKCPKNAIKFDMDDMEFCCFLDSFGKDVFLVVPNLAGHPRNNSATKFKRPPRICENFDYNDVEV